MKQKNLKGKLIITSKAQINDKTLDLFYYQSVNTRYKTNYDQELSFLLSWLSQWEGGVKTLTEAVGMPRLMFEDAEMVSVCKRLTKIFQRVLSYKPLRQKFPFGTIVMVSYRKGSKTWKIQSYGLGVERVVHSLEEVIQFIVYFLLHLSYLTDKYVIDIYKEDEREDMIKFIRSYSDNVKF